MLADGGRGEKRELGGPLRIKAVEGGWMDAARPYICERGVVELT